MKKKKRKMKRIAVRHTELAYNFRFAIAVFYLFTFWAILLANCRFSFEYFKRAFIKYSRCNRCLTWYLNEEKESIQTTIRQTVYNKRGGRLWITILILYRSNSTHTHTNTSFTFMNWDVYFKNNIWWIFAVGFTANGKKFKTHKIKCRESKRLYRLTGRCV